MITQVKMANGGNNLAVLLSLVSETSSLFLSWTRVPSYLPYLLDCERDIDNKLTVPCIDMNTRAYIPLACDTIRA